MEKYNNTAIDELRDIAWEEVHQITIEDNGEPLVPLSLAPEKILVRSAYFAYGIKDALPECYARESVFDRLLLAASLLPQNMRLVILDGWRSPQVQTALFGQCYAALTIAYPEKSEDELQRMTTQYVALPSISPVAPSPHVTGGAIDLSIATMDGRGLNFGSAFDSPQSLSDTRHFEERLERGETLDIKEQDALHNRRILYHAMIEAGFVNYHAEWWHFEYQTQRWALVKGAEHASYGPIILKQNSFADFASQA